MLTYDLQTFDREKKVLKAYICQGIKPVCLCISSGVHRYRNVKFQPFTLIALLCLSFLPVNSLVTIVCKIVTKKYD